MIHYQLRCSREHGFDGWFRDSAAFEHQAAGGLLECPACGDATVTRALMAPALGRGGPDRLPAPLPDAVPGLPGSDRDSIPGPASDPHRSVPGAAPKAAPGAAMGSGGMPAALRASLQALRAEVERRCDYVGPAFAAEARRIHHGEGEARAIYGETTPEQAEALAEEGIEVARIPWVPRADG